MGNKGLHMAYLDLDNQFAAPVASRGRTDMTPAFSPLEWSVVALAKRDGLRSLGEPGRVVRVMGKLFGLATTRRLADERLEALRRIAVHAWRRGFAIPAAEVEAFVAAGYSPGQVQTLVTSITGIHLANGAVLS